MSTGLITGLVIIGIFVCMAGFILIVGHFANKAAKKTKALRLEATAIYMDGTLPCPTCLGRGRILQPDKEWTSGDCYREQYDLEMSEIDIPYLFREANNDK